MNGIRACLSVILVASGLLLPVGCAGTRVPVGSGTAEITLRCSGRSCYAREENPSYATGRAVVTAVRNAPFTTASIISLSHEGEGAAERRLAGGLGSSMQTDHFNGMPVAGSWRAELGSDLSGDNELVLIVEWSVE